MGYKLTFLDAVFEGGGGGVLVKAGGSAEVGFFLEGADGADGEGFEGRVDGGLELVLDS